MPDASAPAPVGGWNARDSVEQMQPTDAIRLINMIPGYQGVTTRGGSVKVAEADDLGGGPVETLAAFEIGGNQKLLCASAGAFYEVPEDINLTPVQVKTGFTINRWQSTHHSQKLIFTNGTDTPQVYDGTTMVDADFSGTVTTPGQDDYVEGFDPTKLWGCITFKGRVFYWEQESQRVLYADIGSFQGQLRAFLLDSMFRRGGTIVSVMTWTKDSGEGMDDVIVFQSSTGECLIYMGDNPSQATQWEMVGRFFLGEPVNIRAQANLAGETVIVTKDGYVNLSTALQQGRVSEQNNISTPIIRAAKQAANEYGKFFGWECTLFPAGSLFIVNVPISEHVENPPGTVVSRYQAEQHVMNTNTGRWSKFEDWNATTFEVFKDELYFATRDSVYRGMFGASDNGDPIRYECITAFSPISDPATRKQLTSAALVTNFEFPSYIQMQGMYDFKIEQVKAPLQPPERVSADWDLSGWDEYYWGQQQADRQTRALWQPVMAYGYQVALGISFQSRAQTITWYSTKMKFLPGSAV